MAPELAPANSADDFAAESDQATPSDGLDNSETWDYAEPDEDQAKPEPKPEETDSNSETDEAQPSQETEEPEAETPETAEKTDKATAEPDDSIVIAMPGGEKLELKELKSGYLRDRDYRHKTTDLANKRRELESMSARVNESANAMGQILLSQVPPEPDPELARTDIVGYWQAKAAHDQAMGFVNNLVQQASSTKDVVNKLTQEQLAETQRTEIAKLTEAFPDLLKPEGKQKFLDATFGAGREAGFTDQELNGINDHRYWKVLHYAKLGMEAEAAKAKVTAKVANVPPVAPQKRPAGAAVTKARANQEAMKRLTQSGSIHDAMAVDFD